MALASGLAILWCATSGIVYLPDRVHDVVWMFLPGLLTMSFIFNLQAISTGKRDLKRVNLFIALSGLLQALWLYGWIHYGLQGLVPGVLLVGLALAPLALWILPPFPLSWPRASQWNEQFRLWAPLASMGAVAALLSPYLQINVRETVLKLGVDATGNWQAAVRITDLLFGTWGGAFIAWALPRLSGPPGQQPGFLKLALAPAGALALGLFLGFGGPMVLDIAYMGRFPQSLDVLRWQCAAEFVRACGLPLAMLLIARRRTVVYIGLELGSSLIQVLLVRMLVPRFGPTGAPIAIVLESSIYLVVTGWVVWRRNDLPLVT